MNPEEHELHKEQQILSDIVFFTGQKVNNTVTEKKSRPNENQFLKNTVLSCFKNNQDHVLFNNATHMVVTDDQEEKPLQTMHEIEFGLSGLLLRQTGI